MPIHLLRDYGGLIGSHAHEMAYTGYFHAIENPGYGGSIFQDGLPLPASGVTILAINASRFASQSIELPVESERYTLTAAKLTSANVELIDTNSNWEKTTACRNSSLFPFSLGL